LDKQELEEQLANIPDEVLSKIAFSMPWQHDPDTGTHRDPDGFDSPLGVDKEEDSVYREALQKTSWIKFHENPQVNTAIRGLVGRLTGGGFETTSGIFEIQEQIELTEKDHRNRLYHFWPKYMGRFNIEGELFLCLTIHIDGFVEIDFIDPSNMGEIIFHSRKALMPLFYNVMINGDNEQIPSIYIARYPELIRDAKKSLDPPFNITEQQQSKSRKHVYKPLGSYYRFIVATDKGFITHRATSYLRTILRWLNHYEDLKNYEIDHKKSSGAYTWVFSFENVADFRVWLALNDEDRRKTGIMQKIEPGCRLFLPPGMKLEAKNPNLTSIRDQDTDILQMVTSGLNEASDVTTGTPAGSYSSVRATRGPMSDRVSDEVAYFDRFLKYDFWSSIFFLKGAVRKFPKYFEVEEAISFKSTEKKNEEGETEYKVEPIFKKIKKRPEDLIDISYPVSETIDYEGRTKAFLGAKHGPVSETLGIPSEDVAKKIGAGNYERLRLRKATEDKRYPKLVYTVDSESLQEKAEGEPTKGRED